MKKRIFIICLIFSLLFVGCSKKESEASDAGEKALKLIDQYLNGDISADDASERLNTISENLDALVEENTTANGDEIDMWGLETSGLASSISMAALSIEYDDVKDVRKYKKQIEDDLKD